MRVGVVDPATRTRSGVWNVWTAKHSADTYLAARALAGTFKVSLHASGSWSVGFVSQDKARPFLKPGVSRHRDIWRKPAYDFPGVRRAFTIVIPGPELRDLPDDEYTRGDVLWVPISDARRNAMSFEIALIDGAQARAGVEFTGGLDLAHLLLSSGDEARIIAHEDPWTLESRVSTDDYRRRMLAVAPENQFADAPTRRTVLFSESPEGLRFFTELAFLSPAG